VKLFLDGAVKIVRTAPWPHYPNKNVFSGRWNRLYGKSAYLRCGSKLFHSPGPASAKALSPKVLWVRVTTHVQLSVERSRRSRASATRRQSSAKCDAESVSATLVYPDKAVGCNEMPFGRVTRVVASNIVLDRGPGLPTARRYLGQWRFYVGATGHRPPKSCPGPQIFEHSSSATG